MRRRRRVAFKLAAQYWHNIGRGEKCEFVGFTEAYHGDTFGAMSVGRTDCVSSAVFSDAVQARTSRRRPSSTAAKRRTIRSAVRERCLAKLRTFCEQHAARRIAAVCIEPIVQGAAGMIVHPPGFLTGVRKLCIEYDVLLLADEVAVGFGRTGRMFACEHEVSRARLDVYRQGNQRRIHCRWRRRSPRKKFTTPSSATRGTAGHFFHGHTYTGNPLACAAGIASLDLFEKNDLLTSVRQKSEILATRLERLKSHRHVGDVRQMGLMVGIELVEDKATRRPFDSRKRTGAAVCLAARKHGVIIRPLGDVIVLMPPPAMPMVQIEQLVNAVELALSETLLAHRRSEG